jgi:hypothetical protein
MSNDAQKVQALRAINDTLVHILNELKALRAAQQNRGG